MLALWFGIHLQELYSRAGMDLQGIAWLTAAYRFTIQQEIPQFFLAHDDLLLADPAEMAATALTCHGAGQGTKQPWAAAIRPVFLKLASLSP